MVRPAMSRSSATEAMTRLFGTDGVRGPRQRARSRPSSPSTSRLAAARVLVDRGEFAGQRPLAVVGRDTRISGQFLEHAVVAGLASAGVDVLRLGVLPTPGVAYLTDALGADLGVVIIGVHNPMPDNGIKFLARGGHQARRRARASRSRRARRALGPAHRRRASAASRPTATAVADVRRPPRRHPRPAAGRAPGRARLRARCGLARGPAALRAAGADVIAINDDPDGLNINEGCGSTHLEGLCSRPSWSTAPTPASRLDGDADRCLAVDHERQRRRRRPADRDPRRSRCTSRACWPTTPSWPP